MTRIRTTFSRPFPPTPYPLQFGVEYPLSYTVSIDVDIEQGLETLNKVLHTRTYVVFVEGSEGRTSSLEYKAMAEVTETIEEGFLKTFFGPSYDQNFDKFLNAASVWDISREARQALNLVEQNKGVPPTIMIEIGTKSYRN